jgi:rhodanese-related sulfurtransferase
MKMAKTHPKINRKLSFPTLWVGLAVVLLIIAAVIIVPQLGNKDVTTKLPLAVSVAQAVEIRDAGAFVLDVREPDEWAQAHIPDATWIPLGDLQNRLSEVPKDQPILVYCRSGNRSQTGRDILLAAGYQNVTSMSGGINEWIKQGLPTVSGP